MAKKNKKNLKKIKIQEVKKLNVLTNKDEKEPQKKNFKMFKNELIGKVREKTKKVKDRTDDFKQRHSLVVRITTIFLKGISYLISSLIIIGIIGGITVYFLFAKDLPDVKVLKDFDVAETTYIYDREGNELYKIFLDENREYIALNQITDYAQKATLAIEDKQFYSHMGFDISSIIRATLKNQEGGDISQGASTITMQLAKNMFLSKERTYERKIKELILAFQIERNFNKSEILEMYLNKIPYGSNSYGIQTAAQTYFGKSANEVDLFESAILASIPKAPSTFSPFGSHYDDLMGYCKLDRPEGETVITNPNSQIESDGINLVLESNGRTWVKIETDENTPEELFINKGEALEFKADDKIKFITGNRDYTAHINGFKLKDLKALDYIEITKDNIDELVEGVKSINDETLNDTETSDLNESAPEISKCTGLYDSNYVKGRKDLVLIRMMDDNYITKEQAEEAWKKGINYTFIKSKITINEPHFVFYVKELLENKYGEELVNKGGLRITTTLDPKLQELAKKSVEENKNNVYKYGGDNQSLTAINPKTGEVYAMIGSIDYYDDEIDGNVNMATAERQPGSSFKPLIYGAAIQNGGYGSGTIISDYKTIFNGNYIPNNSDGSFKGSMSMRKALVLSRNIPAIKAYFLAGEEDPVLDFIDQFGISSLREFKNQFNEGNKHGWQFSYGPPMAIGTGNVKLIDLVAAYGVYANMGIKVPVNPILEIRDRHGNILEKLDPSNIQGSRAVDPQVAFIINDMLSDIDMRPAGSWRNVLTVPGFTIAAKTGTSNKKVGNVVYPSDGLTIGYTPNLAVGVWSGNTDGKELKRTAFGLYMSAPTWNQFFAGALEGKSDEKWEKPDGIIERKGEYYPSWEKEVKASVDKNFKRVKTKEELEAETKKKEDEQKLLELEKEAPSDKVKPVLTDQPIAPVQDPNTTSPTAD